MGRAAAAGILVVLLVSGLAVQAEALHRSAPAKSFLPAIWEKVLKVNIEADSDSSGPHLSLDPNASSASKFIVAGDATSGLMLHAGRASGGAPKTVIEFPLRQNLGQAYHFNLTKRVIGVLWVTNTQSQAAAAADRGLEHGAIRLELLQGENRVAGTEYSLTAMMGAALPVPVTCTVACLSSSRPTTTWIPIYFSVRPEASALVPAVPVKLKLTRFSGLTDLTIGTQAPYQSHFEFRYYDSDPMAGLLYLEKGKLVSSTTGTSLTSMTLDVPSFLDAAQRTVAASGDQEGPYFLEPVASPVPHGSNAAWAMVPLAALPLAGRRPNARFVLLVLLLGALAGCMGGGGGSQLAAPTSSGDRPEPTVRQEIVDNGTAGENGTVEGQIRDNSPVTLPIKDASIAILQTNHFTETSKDGRFTIPDVAPGTYSIRVDKKGFDSIQQGDVVVVAGKITRLNITMAKQGVTTSNNEPHIHPDWVDGDSKPVHDVSFVPEPSSYEQSTYGSPYASSRSVAGSWVCPVGGAAQAGTYSASASGSTVHYCVATVQIDRKNLIPPGTGMLDVTLDWSTSGQAPKELALMSNQMSGSGRFGYYYSDANDPFVPRAPKDPFHIPIFPNIADIGHVKTTRWSFQIALPFYEATYPSQEVLASLGSVSFKLTAHKANVPFEPAHPVFWGNLTEQPLATGGVELGTTCQTVPNSVQYTVYYDMTSWPNGFCSLYAPYPAKVFVPPGTLEIRGKLTWAETPAPVKWGIAYRTPLIPVDTYRQTFNEAENGATAGSSTTFTIKVDPTEVDPFYATGSGWGFYPSDQGDTATRAAGYNGGQFKMSATLVRDPTFTE